MDEKTTRHPEIQDTEPELFGQLTLTIVAHPELGRIGEAAYFNELGVSNPQPLSRNQPLFYGKNGCRPLEDEFVSRKPITIMLEPRGYYRMDPSATSIALRVDGRDVEQSVLFSPEQVSQGLVLSLSQRICLLLHFSNGLQTQRSDMGMLGESEGMHRVRREIDEVAGLDFPVLIRGESGTGKELVARAIHSQGTRCTRKLVTVNMGAIPPSLAASTLFGAQRGSFTGAVVPQEGFFRSAHGGTLFLDEIGEAPPEVQVMLLRTLETRRAQALGANQSYQVDVRLLAATDAPLEALSARGDFKAPLLHRLASFVIYLPPLRDRRDDIMRLFVAFAEDSWLEINETGPNTTSDAAQPWLPTSLVEAMLAYVWPGNVRQLRNVVRQLVINNKNRSSIVDHRGFEEQVHKMPTTIGETRAPGGTRKPSTVSEAELTEAMKAHRWELAPAARALGIARSSIYDLIKKCPRIRMVDGLSMSEINAAIEACGGDLERAALALEVSAHGLRRRTGKGD